MFTIDPSALGTEPDLEAMTPAALTAEPYMRVNGRRPNLATIYRKIHDGTFPSVRVGGRIVTTRRWVLDAIANGSKRGTALAPTPRARSRQLDRAIAELDAAGIR